MEAEPKALLGGCRLVRAPVVIGTDDNVKQIALAWTAGAADELIPRRIYWMTLPPDDAGVFYEKLPNSFLGSDHSEQARIELHETFPGRDEKLDTNAQHDLFNRLRSIKSHITTAVNFNWYRLKEFGWANHDRAPTMHPTVSPAGRRLWLENCINQALFEQLIALQENYIGGKWGMLSADFQHMVRLLMGYPRLTWVNYSAPSKPETESRISESSNASSHETSDSASSNKFASTAHLDGGRLVRAPVVIGTDENVQNIALEWTAGAMNELTPRRIYWMVHPPTDASDVFYETLPNSFLNSGHSEQARIELCEPFPDPGEKLDIDAQHRLMNRLKSVAVHLKVAVKANYARLEKFRLANNDCAPTMHPSVSSAAREIWLQNCVNQELWVRFIAVEESFLGGHWSRMYAEARHILRRLFWGYPNLNYVIYSAPDNSTKPEIEPRISESSNTSSHGTSDSASSNKSDAKGLETAVTTPPNIGPEMKQSEFESAVDE